MKSRITSWSSAERCWRWPWSADLGPRTGSAVAEGRLRLCARRSAGGRPAAAAQRRRPQVALSQAGPGVVEDIYSERKQDESFSRHDIVELLAVDNNFDWAKEVTFATTSGRWISSSSPCG